MSTPTKVRPGKNRATCQCGCNQSHPLNRLTFEIVHPSKPRLLIHRAHKDGYIRECVAVNELNKFVRAHANRSNYVRFTRRKKMGNLVFQASERIHGAKRARREANRAETRFWVPVLFHGWLEAHWKRQDARRAPKP